MTTNDMLFDVKYEPLLIEDIFPGCFPLTVSLGSFNNPFISIAFQTDLANKIFLCVIRQAYP